MDFAILLYYGKDEVFLVVFYGLNLLRLHLLIVALRLKELQIVVSKQIDEILLLVSLGCLFDNLANGGYELTICLLSSGLSGDFFQVLA